MQATSLTGLESWLQSVDSVAKWALSNGATGRQVSKHILPGDVPVWSSTRGVPAWVIASPFLRRAGVWESHWPYVVIRWHSDSQARNGHSAAALSSRIKPLRLMSAASSWVSEQASLWAIELQRACRWSSRGNSPIAYSPAVAPRRERLRRKPDIAPNVLHVFSPTATTTFGPEGGSASITVAAGSGMRLDGGQQRELHHGDAGRDRKRQRRRAVRRGFEYRRAALGHADGWRQRADDRADRGDRHSRSRHVDGADAEDANQRSADRHATAGAGNHEFHSGRQRR